MENEIIKEKSEYDSLREHIASLREQIVVLTAERDELIYRECPRIQAEYDAKIGWRVLELYRAKARLLQLRRAVEILQAARNRQEKKDAEEAKQEAREAYSEYEKRLEENAKKLHETSEFRKREEKKDAEWRERCGRKGEAGRSADVGHDIISGNPDGNGEGASGKRGQTAGPENSGSEKGTRGTDQEPPRFESREEALKFYHRKLVKMLHPDANPNQTKEEAALFLEMEKAFREGDLDKLIEFYDMMISKDAELHLSDTPENIERLREIAQTLEKKKNTLLDQIEEIRTNFPYTAKELLAHEDEVEKILRHIEEGMEEINRQYQELLERFNRLKEGKDPDGKD